MRSFGVPNGILGGSVEAPRGKVRGNLSPDPKSVESVKLSSKTGRKMLILRWAKVVFPVGKSFCMAGFVYIWSDAFMKVAILKIQNHNWGSLGLSN